MTIIIILGQKGNYLNLGILEAYIIKRQKVK